MSDSGSIGETGQTILRQALGERYQVISKLGSGAFGEVYRARDQVLGRDVAIKRVRLDAFAGPDQIEELNQRFLREAQVAAKLRHPNIVTVHDIVSTPTMSFIVMELVDGVTLHSLLQSRKALGLPETLDILGQVGDALDHAHGQHVVHRDVKPANIMIESSGRVKVMDLGIAKIDSGGNLTATGNIVGTPNYMSPEQARGESVDGRSDLFSLGCILYECLSGQKAFRGDSVTAILMKVLGEEPPSIDFRSLGLPPEIENVLGRSLAKRASERFSSGAELVSALRAVSEGPLAAPTLGAVAPAAEPPPIPPTVRRGKAAPGSRSVLPWLAAVVVAGLVVGTLWSQSRKPEVRPETVPEGQLVVEVPPGFFGKLFGRPARLVISIPAETELEIELRTALSSESAQPGDAFEALLASPLTIEGVEAVPSQAKILGHVSHARGAGKASGRGEITLELDWLELEDGDSIAIQAEPISFRARSTQRKDAGIIGGMAGVGAVVGGLLGGKKGAAIGAGAGGSAGVGVVLTTKGEEIVLSEGASVATRLRGPVTVTRDKPSP
jgi:tRNA A-37 threonylcarbamoyl transferase component Bud32